MQQITPFLSFDTQAEEAANYYVSIFRNSKITAIQYFDGAAAALGQPKGSVMTVTFRLDGQEFVALNGGPEFKFSPATSFVINCADQSEVDYYWEKLGEGGVPNQCGWLDDKFGITWQVVPAGLDELLAGTDAEKTQRAWQAMLQMKKIDIETLRRAAEAN